MTAADLSRVDVPAVELTAAILTRRAAARTEPLLPECFHCGSRKGPWVPDPSGARWPSGARVLECQTTCTAADPDRHSLDTAIDQATAHAAATHPETCATDADYPGFDAWITHQQTLNTAARRTR
ncbi:hypothetical protein [Streptomyces sp. JV180]|uniref:hypothetical protein n=1 Tax=Streptomyces sp. JV180 TaxID=858634 RepID=UPI00168A61B5|nr:hypothetical protein [Streptomyces sp. JV180]MBD3549808.1 hypothetical protein [Streptomyces sp. JV180]